MDKSKLPGKDPNEKSLWQKVVDWNRSIEASKKKRALKKRVKANARQQRYKVGK
jgi:hypothetical protein